MTGYWCNTLVETTFSTADTRTVVPKYFVIRFIAQSNHRAQKKTTGKNSWQVTSTVYCILGDRNKHSLLDLAPVFSSSPNT